MESNILASRWIVHLNFIIFKNEIKECVSQTGVDHESNYCPNNSKLEYVYNVCKELLPSHVVSCGKNDQRKQD